MSDVQRTGPQAPSVLVEPGGHSAPGEQGVLRVHARNVTDAPQRLSVVLLGLEPAWTPPPATIDPVAPGATVTFEVQVRPVAGAAPGDYPFVVAVEASTAAEPGAAPARAVTQVAWRVDRRTDLVMSLEPAEARAAFRSRAQVVIASSAAAPTRVDLHAHSERGMGVRLERTSIDVGPHETVRVPVRLRLRRPRVAGHGSRHSYRVNATGSQAPATVRGSVYQRPLFGAGLLRAMAVVTVLCLWLGVAVVGLPWLSDRLTRDETTTQTATESPATDQGDDGAAADEGGGSPAGGGSDKGGDDSTGGPGADGSSDDDDAQLVRLSGSVGGPAPGGVTIQVSPVAGQALDSSVSEDSGASGTASGAASGRTAGSGLAAMGSALRGAPARPVSFKTMARDVPLQRPGTTPSSRTTRTAKDGTWSFGQMPSQTRYLVVLSKRGYQTQRFIMMGSQLAEKPLETALVPGRGTLQGLVRGPDGNAGGVTVTVTDGNNEVTTRTATSGSVGRWSVDGLSTPGTYLVTASAAGLGTTSRRVVLDASGAKTVDLTLQRGIATLAGQVTGTLRNGTPGGLGALTVTATAGSVTRTATTTTGDDAGSFVLPGLPVPATYTVTIEGDGYVTQVRTVRLTAAAAAQRLSFQANLDGGQVTGSVTDENGGGLAGAGLTLSNEDQTYKTMSASDGVGTYRFTGVKAGTYVLSAQTFGHETAFAEVEVIDGRTTTSDIELISIEGDGLTATSFIRGRVVDATAGASIKCPVLWGGEQCRATVSAEVTGLDGTTQTLTAFQEPDDRYVFPDPASSKGLYPGRYRLTFTAPGYEPTTVEVQVAMNSVVEAATAALQPSPSITGSVQTRIGSVPDGTCVIARADGVTVPASAECVDTTPPCQVTDGASGPVVTGVYCAVTEPGGFYELLRLPAGSYRVGVLAPADSEYLSKVNDVLITVGPGDVRRYDPAIDRRGRLNVTALVSSGGSMQTAGFATVIAYPDGGNATPPTASETAGANGYAELRNLPAGRYTVEITTADGTREGKLTGVEVGLNQEIAVPVVATGGVDAFAIHVITQLSSAADTSVEDARVEITGVTGYTGMVADRATVAALTSDAGMVSVCTTPSCAPAANQIAIPLRESRVDVKVTADGFEPYQATGVAVADLATIALQPSGRVLTGSLSISGADAADLDALFDAVEVNVTVAPPGVSAASVGLAPGTGSTRALVWSDPGQPADGTAAGGRKIRPGSYRITVTLPGFDSTPQNLVVPVTGYGAMPQLNLTLSKFGALRVTPMDGSTPVADTVQILTLKDGTSRRLEAEPGSTYVDFGLLPRGTYQVEVRAEGYQFQTFSVQVESGQAVTSPQPVSLTRLNSFTGTVSARLDQGWTRPLAGASMTATRQGGAGEFSGETGADGGYTVTGSTVRQGLETGTWRVAASAAGYQDDSEATQNYLFNGTGEQRTVNRELTPTGATLRLRVVDASGSPIGGLDTRLEYIDLTHAKTVMPVCTPGGAVPGNPPPTGVTCPAGIYLFVGALPLTYTLSINGGSYLPLSMPQTMEAGVTTTITVPLSKPGGSIQGTVTRDDGGISSPAVGADVTLSPCPSGLACTTQTDNHGYYSITQIPAGEYTLTASKDGLQASRGVQLGAAQGLTLDLALVVPTASVPVTLTSVNGFDLTGALVTITDGTRVLGPQPVVRDSGATFTTSFSQVPYGASWRIRVSGPAGHLGTYQSAAFAVNGSSGPPPAMSIRETQLRIAAQGPASAPATVVATVGPSGDRHDVTVPVGDQAVVYVSAESASTVTATAPSGWSATVTGGSVPSGTVTRAVTIALSAATTTTVGLSAGFSVPVAGSLDVPVTVKAGSAGIGGVDVEVEVNRGSGWTSAGTDTTDSNGGASVSVPAGDDAGAISVRAVFAGSSGYAASTSASISGNVVPRSVTATLSWVPGTRTLSAKSTSSGGMVAGHGQLAIEQLVSGNWTSVASTSTVSAGELSVTYVVPDATAASFRSRFVPQDDYYAAATSATQVVAASGGP